MSDPPPTIDQGGVTTISTPDTPFADPPSEEGANQGFIEPRLGIRHLMLWTALSAVLLVALQTRHMQSFYPAAYRLTAWLYPVTTAAVLTVVVLRLAWWWRGGRFLAEPGHGIALLAVLQFVAHAPIHTIWAVYSASLNEGEPTFDFFQSNAWRFAQYFSAGGSIVVGLVSLGFAIWLARHWAWRLYFVASPLMALAIWGLMLFLSRMLPASTIRGWAESGLLSLIHMTPTLLPVAILLLACLLDRRPRDWTHWWGVFSVAVTTLAYLGTVLAVLVYGAIVPS